MASGSRPITAAIVPGSWRPLSNMISPRRCTMRSAASKSSPPAATRAAYSPTLCPATTTGSTPRDSSTRSKATLCTKSAGCAYRVSVSVSSGPVKHSRESDSPEAASARAKRSRASGYADTRSAPIPTACDPWPGNSIATCMQEPPRVDASTRDADPDSGAGVRHRPGGVPSDVDADLLQQVGDLSRQIVRRQLGAQQHGVGDGALRALAVADHDGAVDAEQRRTALFLVVDAAAERIERRHHEPCS